MRRAAPGPNAVHVVVDMQRLFAEKTVWHVPDLLTILPNVLSLARHRPERTLLTRFVTPRSPAEARGAWRAFYRHWRSVTLERMPAAMLDLVDPLDELVPPARVYDKTAHSAFESDDFNGALARLAADTLILSGVETDVCVLGTALAAVDRGYRVIIAEDAVVSSSAAGHRAALERIYTRLDQQVALVTTEALLAAWPQSTAAKAG